jgi:hypothetical protein
VSGVHAKLNRRADGVLEVVKCAATVVLTVGCSLLAMLRPRRSRWAHGGLGSPRWQEGNDDGEGEGRVERG